MNIDERIRKELEDDNVDVEDILAEEKSLFGMLFRTYRGGLRRWVYLGTVIAIVLTVLIVWSGYRFFTAPGVEDMVFWGVVFLLVVQVQIAMKQWIWMEMNRSSLVRETKRLELAIARLGK